MCNLWWPGGLGKVSTHAVVYARLIIEGQDHGVPGSVYEVVLRFTSSLFVCPLDKLKKFQNKIGGAADTVVYTVRQLNHIGARLFASCTVGVLISLLDKDSNAFEATIHGVQSSSMANMVADKLKLSNTPDKNVTVEDDINRGDCDLTPSPGFDR
ncbi:hypothetical protein DCAR_0831715 [Daucus carota subsp. sativus]|uniref:Uncharacterized protein n=1 Tax=Daucus carota subsp. sativus TaxID=79200 RepID=A0A175YM72_DAUCS|nr:hypothetical protein DCAR_0831715 [Daucus carota subsp. sativus]